MAIAPSAIPPMTSGLAPVRGSTRVCTVVAVTTIMPVIGRKPTPGLQRREAEVLLQVVGQEQEDREDGRAGEGDRRVRAAPRSVQDDVQRQQRMRDPPLEQHEGRSAARRSRPARRS